MKIAFITINFHSQKDTLEVIKGLKNLTLPFGVTAITYVVDNDRSQELKRKIASKKDVIYVDSPGNTGFAGGNNLGFKQALKDKADLLVMINNDTIIPKDLATNILASPISDKKVGAVGGLIYFAKGYEYEDKYLAKDRGKVIWYAGGKLDWDNVYANHVGVNEVDHGQYDGQRETDFITGCLFVTKASVLQKVGLLDEKYFLYFEDSDLCMRIKKTGLKLIFDSEITLYHKVAQSSGIGSPLNDYFLTRNRLLFGLTYARFRTKIALLREAVRKLFSGTKAQKIAVKDFLIGKLYGGSWIKTV